MAMWCCMFSIWTCMFSIWTCIKRFRGSPNGICFKTWVSLINFHHWTPDVEYAWKVISNTLKILWLFWRTHNTMQNLFKYYISLFVCLQILHICVCIHGRAVLWKSEERWGSVFSTFTRRVLEPKLRFSDLVSSACIYWDTSLSAIQTLNVTP